MKRFGFLLLGFVLGSCTKGAAPKSSDAKTAEPTANHSAKAAEPEIDPRLKAVEALFEAYKSSHIEKSLMNLKAVYPGDFAVNATWKGTTQTSVQWNANRKKFLNPIKSVVFSDAAIFKRNSKNIYAIVYKEMVETYDKRTTPYYGYLETAPNDDHHFAVEKISLTAGDFDRWGKERD